MNYIAVVEDSAQDRAVLDSYLEKYQQEKNCHFQITHFSDGDEIALGYKGGYDLILMDIEMPGMSGLDAARAVLAQRPGCRVVFVTAYSLFQYAHEAVHLGACDYLLKPVDPDELEASIRRAIRQIETERKLEALAPVQPEPEAPTAPEAPAPAHPESENQQTALVMAHVRRYLEDNYMFDISLDSVGEILHISPAYLSAQFKKYQKMNFLDCLTELRINAAKELLIRLGLEGTIE